MLGAKGGTGEVRCAYTSNGQEAEYDGIPLATFVDALGPLPGARYVCVHAGPYVQAFALESLGRRDALLAYRRDGAPINWDQGGPVRLIPAKGGCFDAVKWVDGITLEADASTATALDIVRARHPKPDAPSA
ncbi:MAG: molybdopterin-dependent oxidoreductase [Dehalococcoidia bacterium]